MKLILSFLFAIVNFAANAQKQALVKQLNSFIPKGFGLKDTAFGDLNNDGKMDVAFAIYSLKEDNEAFEDTAMNMSRPLLLLIQQPDGKLKLAKRNNNLIMCKQCGGGMGDPFESLLIKKNSVILSFYGGSSWRWGDTYGFSWDATIQTWRLTKEDHTSFQGGDPEATTKNTIIPASEIANFNFDNFNINTLSGPGAVTAKVTAVKCFFYNAPNTATKRKAYVMKGDTINIVREYLTYYDTYFTNAKGQVSTGYVLKKDVEKQ
ncbi:MAG: hypothetical protein ABIX01_03045 [Chitinophagaceae bacterium]